MNGSGQTALLDRVLAPAEKTMTPAAARWLVSLQPDPSMEEYLDDLARRSTEGNLTESERAAYEATVSLGDCIALLQAKARKVLSGVNGQ